MKEKSHMVRWRNKEGDEKWRKRGRIV